MQSIVLTSSKLFPALRKSTLPKQDDRIPCQSPKACHTARLTAWYTGSQKTLPGPCYDGDGDAIDDNGVEFKDSCLP